MSDNERLVPEIRFKGYTDAWEQRKLGEVVSRVSSQSDSNALPKIEFEDIISGEGRLNKDVSNKFDNRKGTLFGPENILFGKLRPYLRNWLFADFSGVALGDFWVFVAVDTSPIFDYYLIQTEKYEEVANLSTGTKMPRSDWTVVSNTKFYIPKEIPEQTTIGTFFRTLDSAIAFRQRKLEGLRELKKAYLQQMFPREGEKAPRIRFAGFSGEWEERKLGEIAPLRGGFAFQSEKFLEHGVPIIRISNILSNGEVGGAYAYYSKQVNDRRYILPDRSALLAMSGATTGKVSILKNPHNNKIYQNQRVGYFVDTGSVDYSFVSVLVKSKHFANKLNPVLLAGAQPNISSKDIDSFEFCFPTKIDEQTAIGNFFFALDSKITALSAKIERLKELKKAYLQKMFI